MEDWERIFLLPNGVHLFLSPAPSNSLKTIHNSDQCLRCRPWAPNRWSTRDSKTKGCHCSITLPELRIINSPSCRQLVAKTNYRISTYKTRLPIQVHTLRKQNNPKISPFFLPSSSRNSIRIDQALHSKLCHWIWVRFLKVCQIRVQALSQPKGVPSLTTKIWMDNCNRMWQIRTHFGLVLISWQWPNSNRWAWISLRSMIPTMRTWEGLKTSWTSNSTCRDLCTHQPWLTSWTRSPSARERPLSLTLPSFRPRMSHWAIHRISRSRLQVSEPDILT